MEVLRNDTILICCLQLNVEMKRILRPLVVGSSTFRIISLRMTLKTNLHLVIYSLSKRGSGSNS